MNKKTKIYTITLLMNALTLCSESSALLLNDIHSKLNETNVHSVQYPESIQDLKDAIVFAKQNDLAISISGGKHSMGGQQFGANTVNLDMSNYKKIFNFDREQGFIEVESGIQWPDLINWLIQNQKDDEKPWGIRQKQTGADNLSLGGALSANIHGRGLSLKPMVGDVESFTIINAAGDLKTCSRSENQELFKLAIGGYGLFGVIATIKLRLTPRVQLERVVEIIDAETLDSKIKDRIKNGFLYGDFQFSIDPQSKDFLTRGVFATYKPVESDHASTDEASGQELASNQWAELYALAHTNKSKAYDIYTKFYLSTNGQKYWSDTHQLGIYLDDYHTKIDKDLKAQVPGSEMISEVYVPRESLYRFLATTRKDFITHNVNLIYGTVRFIEKDDETFLPWAKQSYAAIVFNFHVDHDDQGIKKAKADFTRLIDRALSFDGSYFLTYHRWARPDQVLKAYPQFLQFLDLKKKYDPDELFQSDWYRQYRTMFMHR